jgi:hypothetical protein
MSARTRRAGSVAVGVGLALALGACANPPPEPQPEAVPAVAPPAQTVAQATSVLEEIGAVLAAGDATFDATGLPARLSGPALDVRTLEYARAVSTAGERLPTALPTAAQAIVVPETTEWPRTQLVVTEQPETLEAPRILILRQESPRDPYRLWGWARLGPAVQMPATADPTIGSAPLPPDSTELLVPPSAVLTQYADVLANGDASAFAATHPQDFFRQTIEAARANMQAAVAPVGTVAETYVPKAEPPVALATADGGAIVVGAIDTTTTLAIAEPGIDLDPTTAALAGKPRVTSSLVSTWADVLVFYVPPAGATTPVQLLAGEHARTSVAGQ